MNNYANINKLITTLTSIPIEGIENLYFTGSTAFLSKEKYINNILTAILQYILPNKTLVIPTFSFDFCDFGEYIVDSNSTYCGLFAKTILGFSGVERTRWPPVHSFAVAGKQQHKILSINSDATFGRGSVFDYLAQSQTLVVLFGVNVDSSVAHFHYLEELYEVNYRYHKKYYGSVKHNNKVISNKPFYRYVKKNGVRVNSKKQSLSFQNSKYVKEITVGLIKIRYFMLADYINYFSTYFEENIDYFWE